MPAAVERTRSGVTPWRYRLPSRRPIFRIVLAGSEPEGRVALVDGHLGSQPVAREGDLAVGFGVLLSVLVEPLQVPLGEGHEAGDKPALDVTCSQGMAEDLPAVVMARAESAATEHRLPAARYGARPAHRLHVALEP